ncbi:hypothetical protein B0T20DRAFT_411853 [Sordaria brevicollis]|uniref:Uncharacterized protein n=1 Tax=Sordaria brevicollis TaxID=83679 RepID=A0AAE0PEY5_SORBR|nr:hypothetical protein B0T20DRAFT_411853 [Sordaria brevicollis]
MSPQKDNDMDKYSTGEGSGVDENGYGNDKLGGNGHGDNGHGIDADHHDPDGNNHSQKRLGDGENSEAKRKKGESFADRELNTILAELRLLREAVRRQEEAASRLELANHLVRILPIFPNSANYQVNVAAAMSRAERVDVPDTDPAFQNSKTFLEAWQYIDLEDDRDVLWVSKSGQADYDIVFRHGKRYAKIGSGRWLGFEKCVDSEEDEW